MVEKVGVLLSQLELVDPLLDMRHLCTILWVYELGDLSGKKEEYITSHDGDTRGYIMGYRPIAPINSSPQKRKVRNLKR